MEPLKRSIEEPLRQNLSREEAWLQEDKGLIHCWEIGRRRAIAEEELASKCLLGELPPLGWKGGVAKRLKKLEKHGSYRYLAEWQGLRGEDLHLDLSQEQSLVCSRTGMTVIFTTDLSKLAGPGSPDEEDGSNG